MPVDSRNFAWFGTNMKIAKIQHRLLIIYASLLILGLFAGTPLLPRFGTAAPIVIGQSTAVCKPSCGLPQESTPRSVVELYLNRSLAGEFDQILPLIRERPSFYQTPQSRYTRPIEAGSDSFPRTENIVPNNDSDRLRRRYPNFVFTRQFKESRLYKETIDGNQAKLLMVLTNRETGAATVDAFLLDRESSDDNWRIFKVVDPGWAQDYPVRAPDTVGAK